MILLWTLFLFVCVLLLIVVLLQKGDVGGIGGAFGGGGGETAFGVQADTTWKRTTAVLAGLFIVLAMVLGVVSSKRSGRLIKSRQSAPPAAPAAPQTPAGPAGAQ